MIKQGIPQILPCCGTKPELLEMRLCHAPLDGRLPGDIGSPFSVQ